MKIRIKFAKYGMMRFIGHLDIMRYFQKLLRRSQIPIAYSSGMSPHQIMSFAMPLSIGLTSDAEYVDIEITDRINSLDALSQMNSNNVDGIEILSFKELPDNAGNAMASICAASYHVEFREGFEPEFDFYNEFIKLMNQECINVLKKTKKNESLVDIKPGIYEYSKSENGIDFTLSCGSVLNIKPELIYKTVYEANNKEFDDYCMLIKRTEIYTRIDDKLVPLDDIGTDIN